MAKEGYKTQHCQFDFVFSSKPQPADNMMVRLRSELKRSTIAKTTIVHFDLIRCERIEPGRSGDGCYHVVGEFFYTAVNADRQACCQHLQKSLWTHTAAKDVKLSILNFTKPPSCTVTEVACHVFDVAKKVYRKYRRDKEEFHDFIQRMHIDLTTSVRVNISNEEDRT